MPEWADGSAAAELAIAVMLGSWRDEAQADRSVAESISGESYGEWIGQVRELSLRPGTPLVQEEGQWRFLARYDGWYALGPRLFDEHLQRFRSAAASVLGELDPKFDLPPGERYMAQLHKKVPAHSTLIRRGLAESIALLGSHHGALTSCSLGRAQATAVVLVRELLTRKEWQHWASLDDLLPLLAEGAPDEFLSCVESALGVTPCPFDILFEQEGDGFLGGGNYLTGLLWALETLAWDPTLLGRVTLVLGELAAHDPGGHWANRPVNSLTTIFLPWLPQTTAPVEKRRAVLVSLLREQPAIGWKVLFALLPNALSSSSGSRRPEWRQIIAEDWERGVTTHEYWQQVELYTTMIVEAAKGDVTRLEELIKHVDQLTPTSTASLLEYLGSDFADALNDEDRRALWDAITDVVRRHTKFAQSDWAMSQEQLEPLLRVAEVVSPRIPTFKRQRLFSDRDFDLYEDKGSYEEQRLELDKRRELAVSEILQAEGIDAVIAFAGRVQASWRVGIALGSIEEEVADVAILPAMLERDGKMQQFAAGFLSAKFHRLGWSWVDSTNTAGWTQAQIGHFFAFLPFTREAWQRVERVLGADQGAYWRVTIANASADGVDDLPYAIEALLKYERPYAALRCIDRLLFKRRTIEPALAAKCLLQAVSSEESVQQTDPRDIAEIIKALQGDPRTNPDDLFRVEWAYLAVLQHSDAPPLTLERRLASDPQFYSEVIRLVFRSKNDTDERAEQRSESEKSVATQAYRLLNKWRTPPGTLPDGQFEPARLSAWLNEVRRKCSETGHLEMAMMMLGHAFAHAPGDEGGLWIHSAVASALDARDGEEMRRGFATEIMNSRGAHWVDPSGAPERALAEKYRAQADSIENAGFQRLGGTLRQVASSYDDMADRIVKEHSNRE